MSQSIVKKKGRKASETNASNPFTDKWERKNMLLSNVSKPHVNLT